MGRQRGLIQLSGQFGNIQLSMDGENGYARLYTPPSKRRIQQDPRYQLVRNNASEFACACRVVQTLSNALGPAWRSYSERFFQPKLKGKVRKLVALGPGLDGQRRFTAVAHRDFFRNIDLDPSDRFDRRFTTRPTVDIHPDRHTATVYFPSFHSHHHLDPPQGATHFQVFLTVGVVTDVAFHPYGYVSTQPDLDGLHQGACSTEMACDGSTHPGFQLSASLPGLPALPGDACLVVGVGVTFFREIGGELQPLAGGRAMKVVGGW